MKRGTYVYVILAALFCVLQAAAFAQDDESPEQKKLLETLEERASIAAGERNLDTNYTPPGYQLMQEKEADRAKMIREEDSGRYGYGHGYYR